MTAKDFRINNWVESFFQPGRPQQIELITKKYVELSAGERLFFLENEVVPIKVSKEILLAAGFRENHTNTALVIDNWFLLEYNNLYGCYAFVIGHNRPPVPLSKVHRLQNFYYEMSGKELNIVL